MAKEDVDLLFQRVGIVRRGADVFHVLPELFQNLFAVVEDDHAIAGVAARAPEKPGLMAAKRWRETLAGAEEIDGAGLAVVLGEDATVVAFGGGNAVPGDSGFIDDFFPAKLVGVPLWQRGASVRVFHDWELEGEIFRVGEEVVRR